MRNIKNSLFGKNSRCFIVAEISANHAQDFKMAVAMIKKAKECGADIDLADVKKALALHLTDLWSSFINGN